MKTLECLHEECIELLHKNRLLIPLIKAEIEKEKLLSIELEDTLKVSIKENFLKKAGINDKEAEDNWLETNNINVIDFEYFILKETLLKEYCKLNFSNKVESHFLKRKNDLDIVIYSMIRVTDRHKAYEIYLRIIEEGANFGDLASQYSEGIEKSTRGIIGPSPIGNSHPELAEYIRSIQPGKIKPPLAIAGKYLLIRVESFAPAKLDDFMREKMAQELFNSWLEQEAHKLGKSLMEQQHVNVLKSNVL
tara:strand:- start:3577 stop:4323 length:747 start_codon:yes stop_codon:yes gene_type:complete